MQTHPRYKCIKQIHVGIKFIESTNRLLFNTNTSELKSPAVLNSEYIALRSQHALTQLSLKDNNIENWNVFSQLIDVMMNKGPIHLNNTDVDNFTRYMHSQYIITEMDNFLSCNFNILYLHINEYIHLKMCEILETIKNKQIFTTGVLLGTVLKEAPRAIIHTIDNTYNEYHVFIADITKALMAVFVDMNETHKIVRMIDNNCIISEFNLRINKNRNRY